MPPWQLAAAPPAALLALAVSQAQMFRGYDAYVHAFLASHYLRSWWVTWEPRWYAGFDVVSYPPLAHQLLALLAAGVGLDSALKAFSIALVVALPLAVRRYAAVFVDGRSARLAAAVCLLFPAFALILITNGQLPGVLSLTLLLLALPAGDRFVRRGSALFFVEFVAGVGAGAAAHHATPVLFGPFLILAWLWRRFYSLRDGDRKGPLRRAIVLLMGAVASAGLVIWPFWRWWVERLPQTPIDHISRHSSLVDPTAAFVSLWLPYSLWLACVPVLILLARRRKRLAGLTLAALVVFTLSLGGTTPLPAFLYGSQWEWLTYERYALWAGVLMMPVVAVGLRELGARMVPVARNLTAVALATLALAGLVPAGWYGTLVKLQPESIDLQPIARFLAQQDHRDWRYLTLGLGDQLSLLSTMTDAESVDGDYNSARRDPLLLGSGVEKLDSIRYWDADGRVLEKYLLDPASHSLRWVFSNDHYYDDLLRGAGWRPVERLSDGVVVWSPKMTPPVASQVQGRVGIESVWWGTAPLGMFMLFVMLELRCYRIAAIARRIRLYLRDRAPRQRSPTVAAPRLAPPSNAAGR